MSPLLPVLPVAACTARSCQHRVLVKLGPYNREFVIGGGTQSSTEPIRAGGFDGSAAAEERDNYHRDAYMNDRNHASGAPRPGCE